MNWRRNNISISELLVWFKRQFRTPLKLECSLLWRFLNKTPRFYHEIVRFSNFKKGASRFQAIFLRPGQIGSRARNLKFHWSTIREKGESKGRNGRKRRFRPKQPPIRLDFSKFFTQKKSEILKNRAEGQIYQIDFWSRGRNANCFKAN